MGGQLGARMEVASHSKRPPRGGQTCGDGISAPKVEPADLWRWPAGVAAVVRSPRAQPGDFQHREDNLLAVCSQGSGRAGDLRDAVRWYNVRRGHRGTAWQVRQPGAHLKGPGEEIPGDAQASGSEPRQPQALCRQPAWFGQDTWHSRPWLWSEGGSKPVVVVQA